MKNLAGNDVSIFLYQFVLRKNAISFVLNEGIAEDMYADIEEKMQPLVHACSETLMRHRHLCPEKTIMDGNILIDNFFEVMLSKGLGKHFAEREKQNLFNDANTIAQLLTEVMDRRTKESEQGIYSEPQAIINKIQRTGATNKGLEALGRERQQLDELSWCAGEIPSLNRLQPDDLPQGVVAKKSYDHRGHCIAFEHVTFGELGKIILIDIEGSTQIEADLSKGDLETLGQRRKMLEKIIATVELGLRNELECFEV